MTGEQAADRNSGDPGRGTADCPALLAVDLGVRTGLACFGGDGRLLWYRSTNFGGRDALRRAAARLLDEHRPRWVAAEGGGAIASLWERAAHRRSISYLEMSAEDWREDLLLPRERRSGAEAKRHADAVARRVIAWSGAPRPVGELRHDTAEAILAGFWALREIGIFSAWPDGVVR